MLKNFYLSSALFIFFEHVRSIISYMHAYFATSGIIVSDDDGECYCAVLIHVGHITGLACPSVRLSVPYMFLTCEQ